MSASPDSLVDCKCCGKDVIKVKCPYSCNKKSFLERSEKSPFFLKRNNCGEINLDVYHTHYCQVQAQLKFCHAKYADFVV